MPTTKAPPLDNEALQRQARVIAALHNIELATRRAANGEVMIQAELAQARLLITGAFASDNPLHRLTLACDALRDAIVIASNTVPLSGHPGADSLVHLVINAHAHAFAASAVAPDGLSRKGRKLA